SFKERITIKFYIIAVSFKVARFDRNTWHHHSEIANLLIFTINSCNPVVANGYFVGISAQVFYHIFWTSKRLFGINHPLFTE
ncbi:hypothetical protein, partial [Mariniflexile ostreae]|uniref:hypothetical protein n=1 Tax=Mariniflexile ostreae TaxID=1520892 RepID=UPI0036D28738